MAERGRECVDVLMHILNDGLRPTMALHQISMIWGANQVTAQPPMREAISALHQIKAQSGVVCGSIAVGYRLADVSPMGASVYIVTEDNQLLAQQAADELGTWIYERRADWYSELPSTAEALAQSHAVGRYPVVVADTHPGDSTGMLRTFVEADLVDACILYIVDPEAVEQCRQAGVGATLRLDVGGKSSPLQGEPVQMTAQVLGLSDGRFHYAGPMYAGLAGNMGPSAYIREEGLHVILVSIGEQPYDTAFAQSLGLDPHQMRYIGLKSTAHFRAGFEARAGIIYVVSEPGVHNPTNLTFERLGRQVYPLGA
jgi:microcystin degradation protein MlrC